MALLWFDGFEGYGDTADERVQDAMSRRYTTQNYLEIKNDGRWGSGWAIQPEYQNCDFVTPALTTNATMIVAFAVKWPDDTMTWNSFCIMRSGGADGMGVSCINEGTLIVRRGTTEMARSVPGIFNFKRWHWVEFKVYCHNTAGTFEVKVDGNVILSATGVDTQVGATAYHDAVKFTGMNISTVKTPRFDDIVVMDGSGSEYNDYIGQRRVETIVPTSDTADIDWTTSSGSTHYVLVDDLDPDDDTNYVEDTVSANEDIWGYGNLSLVSTIDALCLHTDVRVTDATSYTLKTTVKSGGTKYTNSGDTISSTSYAIIDRLMLDDPDTSSAWTESGINAVEMGVEVG
jgi:hypothetical protein